MENGNLKTWLDFFKWFAVSVVIAVASLWIDTNFKKRSANLTEMAAFDKHTELITDYNKVAERRLLAQYFATVTPNEELRQRWAAYFEIVNQDYQEQQRKEEEARMELRELEMSNNLSREQTLRKSELSDQVKRYQYELTPEFESKNPRIIVPQADTLRLRPGLQRYYRLNR